VGDRPAEYLAITAEHYERAGDHAKALDYFHRAARDAQKRFANQSALEYTERALRNPAATDPRQRDRLYWYQHGVADLVGRRALQETALAERAEIAESLDDDAMRADVLASRALLASRRGDEALAFDLATQAAEVAGRSGNDEAGALALGQIAWSRYYQGDIELALRDARDAVGRARQALADEMTPAREALEVQTLTLRAIIEQSTGDLVQARTTLNEALSLARERGFRRPAIAALETLGVLERRIGNYAQALSCFEASTARAAEIGWTKFTASGRYEMACCSIDLGQPALALEQLAAAESDALRCESRSGQARCLHLRARVEAAAGNGHAAEALFGRAGAMFESIAAPAFACQVSADQALLYLAEGRLAEAGQLVEKINADLEAGLSLAATDDVLSPRLACHRVWAATGDPRAAEAINTAHAELQALVAKSGDEDTRLSILENVLLHREIIAAWAAQQAGSDKTVFGRC
ncbi:MAG: tetratricopeptide repeat protein, partial [Caldimonas sp.]